MVRTKNTNMLSISILIVFESIELNAVLVYDYRQREKRDQRGHSSATVNVRRSGTRDTHKEKQNKTDVVQFSSLTQSCLTLCDPMNHSTPGLPVHHQLLEFTQTHVHWVTDAIQPSHPLLSPSPPAPNLSQYQGLFPWVPSSDLVAKVLEFQLQHHQSFQWIFRTDFLQNGLVGSPCSPRDPQESSPTPQFKSINSSALSFLYGPTLTSVHDDRKNHKLWLGDLCRKSNVFAFECAV